MVKSKKKKLKKSKRKANIKNIKYWMWRDSEPQYINADKSIEIRY